MKPVLIFAFILSPFATTFANGQVPYFTKINGGLSYEHDSSKIINTDESVKSYKQTGETTGFYGNVESLSKAYNLYFKAGASLKFGNHDITARTKINNNLSDIKGKANNIYFDSEVLLGKAFSVNNELTLAPYLGYGSYVWDIDVPVQTYKNITVSHSNELFTWTYLKVGLKSFYQVSSKFSFNPEIQIARTLDSKVQLKDNYFTKGEFREFKLKEKFHTFINLETVYKVNEKVDFSFTPFYAYKPTGKSETKTIDTYEIEIPAMSNHAYGAKFGIGVYF